MRRARSRKKTCAVCEEAFVDVSRTNAWLGCSLECRKELRRRWQRSVREKGRVAMLKRMPKAVARLNEKKAQEALRRPPVFIDKATRLEMLRRAMRRVEGAYA